MVPSDWSTSGQRKCVGSWVLQFYPDQFEAKINITKPSWPNGLQALSPSGAQETIQEFQWFGSTAPGSISCSSRLGAPAEDEPWWKSHDFASVAHLKHEKNVELKVSLSTECYKRISIHSSQIENQKPENITYTYIYFQPLEYTLSVSSDQWKWLARHILVRLPRFIAVTLGNPLPW